MIKFKKIFFVAILLLAYMSTGNWWEFLPDRAGELAKEVLEIPEAQAATITNTRVNTVEFFGGQYDGTATGENDSTVNNFAEQAFMLKESSVDIVDAFIEVSFQHYAYTASTGGELLLYFDACSAPCTPSTAIVLNTAGLGTGVESQFGLYRASVSAEATMAAYIGGGASVSFQIGYCTDGIDDSSCAGTGQQSHQAAKAKLVVTYTYNATSSMLTNTVVYPVASASDVGSKPSNTTTCTVDTSCPMFYYNADIPEFGNAAASRSQFFDLQAQIDSNGTTDVSIIPQVDGNANGATHFFEAALNNNGGWVSWYIDSLTGYANNTAQRLEIGTNATNTTVLGGENYVTYTYSSNAAVKTKTVVFPVGEVCTTGCTTLSALTGPTVYFPEEGVSVKKAWFRVHATDGGVGTGVFRTLDIVTAVGNNAETASTAYSLTADNQNMNESGYLIHLIPSADYAEMALADKTNGKAVQMRADWDVAAGAISAELVITYQYTSDAGGYLQTQTLIAGQGTTAISAAGTFISGVINPSFPETSGSRFIRGVSLQTNGKDTTNTADGTVGSNLAVSGCSASATSTPDTDGIITAIMHFKSIVGVVDTYDATTYRACYTGSQTTILGGKVTITYQINLPVYNQSAYRFFTNDNATTVTTALAVQDTAATLTSDAQIFRLRMLTHVASGSLALNGDTFKLQFAPRSGTCDTAFSGETYVDISGVTSISFDTTNTPADGDNLTANHSLDPDHSTHASISQDYEEANNFGNSVAVIASGSDGLWDFALKDFDADASDVFCLRAVRSDGSLFTVGGGSYLVIPQITIFGAGTFTQNDYEWFYNVDNVTPVGSIQGAENTQADIGTNTVLPRLRMNITVGGATLTATSQKFKLQHATSAGGPWTDVSTGAWSFKNNSGAADGATLASNLISTTEVSETYNETNPTLNFNPNSATVGQDIEYDWSLDPANTTAGTVYFFRMIESDDSVLTAYNRYPSIKVHADVTSQAAGSASDPSGGGSDQGGGGTSGGGAGQTKVTFSTAGNSSWQVPAGVTSITVKAWGGGGGGGAGQEINTDGGGGGFAQGTITVTPLENLNVYVGGAGVKGGAVSSGGGGGYSGIQRSSIYLIQAGGGGGSGGGGSNAGDGGNGGAGGGSSGIVGSNATGSEQGSGGSPGTSSVGGGGGTGHNGTDGGAGSANTGGTGGSGGGSAGGINGGGNSATGTTNGAGGGGGGRFGGGGGENGNGGFSGGGGGGGGSSLVTGSGTVEIAGSGTTPGNNGDTDYTGSVGAGGDNAANGNDGYVVIIYTSSGEGGSGGGSDQGGGGAGGGGGSSPVIYDYLLWFKDLLFR